MDRIDLKCWVPPLLDAVFDEPDGEPSSVIRERVIAAREMQHQRYAQVGITRNAELGPGHNPLLGGSSPARSKPTDSKYLAYYYPVISKLGSATRTGRRAAKAAVA